MRTIIQQLTDIYLHREDYHDKKLSFEDTVQYFNHALERKTITYIRREGRIVAYAESFCVDPEQLDRVIKGDFHFYDEDLTGDLAYIYSIWVDPEYKHLFKKLIGILKIKHRSCKFTAWNKRNTKRYRIFRLGGNNG